MSGNLPVTLQRPSYLPSVQSQKTNDDLILGAGAGFPVISFRGRVWRIVSGGDSTPVMDANGQPVPSIEVVIIKGHHLISKIFYHKAYVEGSDEPPDCYSNDGVAPHPSIENPQASSCAMCPQNVWGSKITPQGTKVKACSDSRRLAVVPAGEIASGNTGLGAMLMRVPPASLDALRAYGVLLDSRGLPYYAVVTRLGFDLNASYPKLTFIPVRVLSEAEYLRVQQAQTDERVGLILGGLETEFVRAQNPVAAPIPAPVAAPVQVAPPQTTQTPAEATPEAPKRRRRAAEAPAPQAAGAQVEPPPAPIQTAPAPAQASAGTAFGSAGVTPPPPPPAKTPPNIDIRNIVSSALASLDDSPKV